MCCSGPWGLYFNLECMPVLTLPAFHRSDVEQTEKHVLGDALSDAVTKTIGRREFLLDSAEIIHGELFITRLAYFMGADRTATRAYNYNFALAPSKIRACTSLSLLTKFCGKPGLIKSAATAARNASRAAVGTRTNSQSAPSFGFFAAVFTFHSCASGSLGSTLVSVTHVPSACLTADGLKTRA